MFAKSAAAILAALASCTAAQECVPSSSPPISCVDCGKLTPVNVPFDNVGKLWGAWYVIGSEYNATDVSTNANSCTQLNWVPDDATNPMTNLSYLAFYNKGNQPYGTPTNAAGAFYTTGSNFSTDAPPYMLEVPAGSGYMSPFYFAATNGDSLGNGITALVTYVCPEDGKNSQMFFLSRKPYFYGGATFASMSALAAQALSNFGDHGFTLPKQMMGWCAYPFPDSVP